jgi:hypothetical protein
MFEQDVLDLGGIDLEPAAVDDVLDAIDDPATNSRSVACVLLK